MRPTHLTMFCFSSLSGYLRDKGIPVVFAKTGVKHVHHEAEKYDIGIYFEVFGERMEGLKEGQFGGLQFPKYDIATGEWTWHGHFR